MRCAFISDFIFTKYWGCTVHLCNINVSCFTNRSWISGSAFWGNPQIWVTPYAFRERRFDIPRHQLCAALQGIMLSHRIRHLCLTGRVSRKQRCVEQVHTSGVSSGRFFIPFVLIPEKWPPACEPLRKSGRRKGDTPWETNA